MITSYKIEEKTKELALEKIMKDFNLSEKDFYIIEEKTSSGLFKNKKIELEFVKKEDILSYIQKYINTFSEKVNLDITMKVLEKETYFSIELKSSNNSLLIGKDGKNMNSLQHMIQQSLKKLNIPIKVFIDVEHYTYKKDKRFEQEIKKIAQEVIHTKIDVNLDPMNAYDRRIVHTIIGQFENLKSISMEEEPNRYIQIHYVEK